MIPSSTTTQQQGKRLIILSDNEIDDLYSIPDFTHEDRIQYFSLSSSENVVLKTLRTMGSKLFFILQLGYFKAKKQFFIFTFQERSIDTLYLIQRYFLDGDIPKKEIFKQARLAQQKQILGLYDYQFCNQETKIFLQEKALQLAKVCTKPIYIFKELVNYLESKRIVLPGYSFLQEEVVGKALTNERIRLESAINEKITPEIEEILKGLLKADNDLYALTILRKEPKDFGYKEMSFEIKKMHDSEACFHICMSISGRIRNIQREH